MKTVPGKKPDFILKYMRSASGYRGGRIGAAYKNPDGSVRIHLDELVVLKWEPDLVLMLFERESKTHE